MTNDDYPTDPNAETIGLPSDDSGKGSVPEPGKFATQGIPTEIGRYRILGVIGTGGMGAVYEAMQEAPRRRVALKVIKVSAASEMALHRFHFEAQTLAKLSHPNIAQIYEAGMWDSESGEVPFFAMEYIPGARGIVSYVEKKDLSLKDRLELFAKICDAVHHAHQKGIIHRDLKPDNILVDSNGDAKIIDFGVARATDADLAVTTMQTTMGQLIGTLQYMSPEQCDADPDRIDTRSDVYALGVILFQVLSGKLPYDLRRQAIHEAVRIIKEERPTSMGTIDTSLKGDVDTIALKAMEKDCDRRYQSAAELANDINHFLNNEPIIARPLSIGYQTRLFMKKYKRTCAAVILLAVSIVLGIIGTTWGMVEANHQKSIAIEQRNLAEDRYDSILDMSKDVIGGFYSGIVKLNAAMDVRKLVLDSSMEHLSDLEKTAGSTQKIRASKAKMHSLYGDYYAGLRGANVGELDKAVNEHQTAIELYSKLVDEGLLKHHFHVALGFSDLADLSRMNQEYGDSLALLNNAKDSIMLFLIEFPEQTVGHRLDSRIFLTRFDVLQSLDRHDEAKAELDENVAKRKKRTDESPNNPVFKRDYAVILQRVGSFYSDQEEFDLSIEQHESSRDIFELLVKAQPTNGQAVRDLAWQSYFLGEVYIEDGQHDKGLNMIETGVTLIQERCVADTTDYRTRNDAPKYLKAYVYKCGELGVHERAKKTCYNVLLVLQPVLEANPDNYALAEMYGTLQKLHDEIGQIATAE